MSDVFLGEIRAVPFNFPPKGWAFCQGQLMSIAQNTALFALLGTTYGGNGISTFALPNLQGQVAISSGQSIFDTYFAGEMAGEQTITLLATEIPAHTHTISVDGGAGTTGDPTGATFASPALNQRLGAPYGGTEDTNLNPGAMNPTGSSLPHNNLQPYLTLNYIIALSGIFPARS